MNQQQFRGHTINTQGRFVNGIMRGQEVSFLLDTGAGYNFLSPTLWKQIFNDEEIQAPSRLVTAFDGSSISIRGEVLAKFTLDKSEIETLFLLCNNQSDNILGMDFFLNFCSTFNFSPMYESLGIIDDEHDFVFVKLHSSQFPSVQAALAMPDYSGYQQMISELIEAQGDFIIRDVMSDIQLYMKKIAYLKLDRQLPQRKELSEAVKNLRSYFNTDQSVAILLGAADEVHEIIQAESQVANRDLLNIEFRWLFSQIGWPSYHDLPNPCSF